ncbi:hypothetical protein J2W80_004363 [Methylorubrum extorquens]|nr:hypothetical protein [Methylorubrum extorquens]MCP1588101.1 hypothetical protein [Methylorubrum extorquens]
MLAVPDFFEKCSYLFCALFKCGHAAFDVIHFTASIAPTTLK